MQSVLRRNDPSREVASHEISTKKRGLIIHASGKKEVDAVGSPKRRCRADSSDLSVWA
jgi:hypothetical protein